MDAGTVTDIIALVFDFDDTLMPDSTSKLLRTYGIKPEEFWSEAATLIKAGYDQPCAYLRLLLDNIGEGKPFGKLSNSDLEHFGRRLDGDFFPGLPNFFDEIHDKVKESFKNIQVEFYVVSGGLQAILQGNHIINQHVRGVYGCQLGEDDSGVIRFVKRSITFTEKTRYLFEINKGIEQSKSQINPFLVNEDIPTHKRRIPFQNMVYVGDGLTDIPCFSLIKAMGGKNVRRI